MRRSRRLVTEMTWRHNFISPWYCRDCKKRFQVITRNTYVLGGLVGLAIVVGITGWYAFVALGRYLPEPELVGRPSVDMADAMKRAEQNDPLAELALAQMYAQGNGVPKSEADARVWLERAAEHGNADAQFEMAMSLREGRGVIQDYEGALKWLQRAAENDNALAQYELGYMYRVGMGTPVDNVKAYVWFNLAAARGNVAAVQARLVVLPLLSRSEVVEAQSEARRLNAERAKPLLTSP